MSDICRRCVTPDPLAAPRHVAQWAELSASEQMILLAALGAKLSEGATGFETRSDDGHFHFHPIAARPRVTTGETDPLLPLVSQSIDAATGVDLAVAFAMESGVALLEPWFRDLLDRGGALRIVVGDYLDVTDPAALWRLLDLEGAQVRVFETGAGSFHPKAWLFRAADRRGLAIVGSSNLSATALTHGVEWNLHSETAADAVGSAFETLWTHPRTRSLSADWIAAYAARRAAGPLPESARKLVAEEPTLAPPAPHAIQAAALEALQRTRADGHRAGLVVMATGLGKTWTAAFDSLPFARVLFAAHRDEILAQALRAFRTVRPEARIGRFDGMEKEAEADLLFASIQTLGRVTHLRRFAPDAFDYIVVDEFHHAAAGTYRKLLDHFTPRFLLGLTATPDRADGADLLALCGDNLVYHCDLFEGIEAGLLSRFHYFGVPDNVDYAQIPWRSAQFDPEALEAALATEARAGNAYEQFQRHRAGPGIGFCVSTRHADYMAAFFEARGLRAVAVHSGPGSAPRSTSLDRLGRGEIDILFAVDMFNEGVDVPEIGTVMMLRPTESIILWLQQLGRGLRRVPGKILRVVDYIGNHRVFLTKLRALLAAGPADRSIAQKLEQVIEGRFALPPGCEITYDLVVIETLRALLRSSVGADDMEARYRDFRIRHGVRPTAAEMAGMGFDPRRSGHGGWFDYVRDMGDLAEDQVLVTHGELLRQAERPSMSEEALRALRTVFDGGEASEAGLAAWAFTPVLRREGDRLRLARPDATGQLPGLVAELLDWRLREQPEMAEAEAGFVRELALWSEYPREEIPGFFGSVFNPGNWNSGIVSLPGRVVLLTTLKKHNLSIGGHYEDGFLSPTRMTWQSQTQTKRESKVGRVLSGREPGVQVHLFVRSEKLRHGKGAPFVYCGCPRFVSWQGEAPITVAWELPAPVPEHLRRSLGVPDG